MTRGLISLLGALLLAGTLAMAQGQPVRVVLRDGVTLAPLRYLAEWQGATLKFVDKTGEIAVTFTTRTVLFKPGSANTTIDGQAGIMPYKLLVVDGTAYVPVRAMQWLGARVSWDEAWGDVVVKHPYTEEQLLLPTRFGEQSYAYPLHIEAYSGLVERVKARLAQHEDANLADSDGLTPLQYAAMRGRTSTVEALLAGGADIYARKAGGMQAIHYAAMYGQADTVALLLAKGAGASARSDPGGLTPLHCAAMGRDGGAGKTAPTAEAQAAQRAVAEALLAHGADLEARDALAGWLPLHSAAASGQTAMVDLLLARGADLHARDAKGRTALHVAALQGRVDTVGVLLTYGADATACDLEGKTALDTAMKTGPQALVALLTAGPAVPTPPAGGVNEPVPAEFAQGRIDGKYYFIRLKHAGMSWNAYNDGIRRLLAFLSPQWPCQDGALLMDAPTLQTLYLSQPQGVPPFLYLYCDEKFALGPGETALLRDYLRKGGFLFLDGPSGLAARLRVAREMDRVLPGVTLAPLPANHAIYHALYRLPAPAVGENVILRTNYGASVAGRLAIFYTQGNYSRLFSRHQPEEGDYLLAQYQMAANVITYALHHGDLTGVTPLPGADPSVTPSALDLLGPTTQPAKE